MAPIALALNTTTEVLELMLAEVNTSSIKYLKRNEWTLGRELSVLIHGCLKEFMQDFDWADLAFVVIASGVGSFTSTRIGVVVARTLGEQLQIPVFTIANRELETQRLEFPEHDDSIQNPKVNLLKIGYGRWLRGNYSHWSEALPLYV